MTDPPMKYAEAPGIARSEAEIKPAVEDSATATVCCADFNLLATSWTVPDARIRDVVMLD